MVEKEENTLEDDEYGDDFDLDEEEEFEIKDGGKTLNIISNRFKVEKIRMMTNLMKL